MRRTRDLDDIPFPDREFLADQRAAHLRDLRERALGPWRWARRRRAEDALLRRFHHAKSPFRTDRP